MSTRTAHSGARGAWAARPAAAPGRAVALALGPCAAIALTLGLALGLCVSSARADVVYETADPFGGMFGIMGFDVFRDQSVALRFIPTAEYRLDQLRLWLWNNDGQGGTPRLDITLRDEGGTSGTISFPGQRIHESWVIYLPNTGVFRPVLFDFDSALHPRLHAGMNYWIVAESDAVGGYDPVWAWAQPDLGFMSFRNPPDPWQPGHSGAVAAAIVLGTPVPRTPGDLNCDGSVTFDDINPFVLALTGAGPYYEQYPDCNWQNADCNADGRVDFDDINPFVALLVG
ncbi:MAG: hypothetical protein AB1716_00810 [Planctomycetota bacterium]